MNNNKRKYAEIINIKCIINYILSIKIKINVIRKLLESYNMIQSFLKKLYWTFFTCFAESKLFTIPMCNWKKEHFEEDEECGYITI